MEIFGHNEGWVTSAEIEEAKDNGYFPDYVHKERHLNIRTSLNEPTSGSDKVIVKSNVSYQLYEPPVYGKYELVDPRICIEIFGHSEGWVTLYEIEQAKLRGYTPSYILKSRELDSFNNNQKDSMSDYNDMLNSINDNTFECRIKDEIIICEDTNTGEIYFVPIDEFDLNSDYEVVKKTKEQWREFFYNYSLEKLELLSSDLNQKEYNSLDDSVKTYLYYYLSNKLKDICFNEEKSIDEYASIAYLINNNLEMILNNRKTK